MASLFLAFPIAWRTSLVAGRVCLCTFLLWRFLFFGGVGKEEAAAVEEKEEDTDEEEDHDEDQEEEYDDDDELMRCCSIPWRIDSTETERSWSVASQSADAESLCCFLICVIFFYFASATSPFSNKAKVLLAPHTANQVKTILRIGLVEMIQEKIQTLKLHELLYQSDWNRRDIDEQPLRQVQAPGKINGEVDSGGAM